MNERQRRFADEYIRLGNAHQAAINAGYSEGYARTNAHKLRENTSIKPYIDKRLREMEKQSIADIKEVMEFYTNVLRGNITEESVVSTPLGVEKVGKIPDVKDKLRAGNELMKRLTAGNRDELKNELLEAQIKKILKEIEVDSTVEDRLTEYFDKLDEVMDEE